MRHVVSVNEAGSTPVIPAILSEGCMQISDMALSASGRRDDSQSSSVGSIPTGATNFHGAVGEMD